MERLFGHGLFCGFAAGANRYFTSLLALAIVWTGLAGPTAAHAACTYTGVGNNNVGQTDIPPGLSSVLLLTSGASATAALKKDGSFVVWGNDFAGLVSQAPTGSGYKDVALSNTHGLAVTASGDVVCWSTGVPSPCSGKPASFADAVTVAAGNNTSFVVRANGEVVAWGSSPFNGPALANGATGIKRVFAGGALAAGLTTDGYVVTWDSEFATPGTLGKARTVAVSQNAYYALTEAGTVVQWGLDFMEPMPTDLVDIIDINAASGLVVATNGYGNARVWGDSASLLPEESALTNVSMFGVGPGFLIREDCGGTCGQLGSLGCCDGTTIKYCVDGTPNMFECSTQPNCGWETDVEAFDCAVQANPAPNPKVRSWCAPNYGCEPNCGAKVCGDDGCGGACGTCGVDQVCEGTSGTCLSAPPVDAGGAGDTGLDTSDITCTPDCFGKACGPDGCGGECGICTAGQSCDGAGQCVPVGACNPDNVDCRACVCQNDSFCCTDWDETCANGCTTCSSCSDTCVPACDGKSCGDDGCGGSCGSCDSGKACEAGACVVTCQPACAGKNCGSDGCSGSCGSCAPGSTCENGTCVAPCQPNCTGKTCGSDGCGGNCGTCGSGQSCGATGTCVASCSYIGVGNKNAGQSVVPAGLSDVVLFTSGSSATAALKKDGSIVVWGNDFAGLVSKAPKGSGFKDVALSNTHGLAVTATGSVVCWGNGEAGEANVCAMPPGLSGVATVAAGGGASYAVKTNGDVVAWGSSNFNSVKLANGAKNIRRVVAAGQFAGGITTNGYVVTWADGLATPATLGKVRTLAVSHAAYFALKPTGEVVRWSLLPSEALPPGLSDVVDIAAADGTIVALTSSGQLRTWGVSAWQLGDLSAISSASMIAVGPGFLIRQECVGCAATSVLGCCDGTATKTCTGGVLSTSPCSGGACGFAAASSSFVCDAGSQTATNPKIRSWCAANPSCVGSCAGKSCGDDGCGNLCGTCGAGTTCNDPTGQCVCIPQCSGKSCGADSCGGSCGLCPSGTACESGTGQCKCVPKCDGKTCGSDGCGGSCGTCTATQSCNPTGACQEVCKPNCDGKTCGLDGCGGTCGSCGPATGPGVYFCHSASGTCRHFKCPNLPKDGCCDGEKAFYCGMFGVNVEKDCKAEGKYCGWEPKSASTTIEYASYMCTNTPKSIGPVGKPRTCPGKPECVPSCSGKSCGSDGCGGSCGTCASNAACNFATGACTPTDCPPCKAGEYCNKSTLQCQKSACPDVQYEGCCKGNTFVFCGQSNAKVYTQNCKAMSSAAPQTCGWNGNSFGCAVPSNVKATPANLVKECPDSVCVPSCTGKTCGSDGCGGSCGSCASGETCQADGTCKKPCTPVCDRGGFTSSLGQGKYVEYTHCGYSDGCGGTCGCGAGKFCNIYGTSGNPGLCWDGEDECAKVGVGKKGCCAGDGQYKYCWSGKVISENCTSGPCTWFQLSGYNAKYSCSYSGGTATADPSGQAPRLCGGGVQCTPQCTGKACGPDGCGGFCGTCGAGQKCDDINGSCMTQCKDEVPFDGCCDGNVLKVCGKQVYYDADTKISTTTCAAGTCGWSASGGKYACNTAAGSDPTGKVKRACKCVPQCSGKTCGPDGCGGTCGTCTSGQTCSQETPTWQNNYVSAKCCTPQCSGKTCGPNGCGGTCGTCGAGKECDGGTCVNLPPAPSCSNTKWQGSCNGNVLQFCSGSKIITQDCGASGQNWCGWNAGLQAYSCGTTGQADPSGLYPKAAAGTKVQCVPNCSGKQCGQDGCGGLCGTCNGDGGYCSNGKCTFQIGEPNYAYLYCPGKANQKVSAKTGQCTLDNQNKCKLTSGVSFCGQSNEDWTCQCDAGCSTRGDCCTDYSNQCVTSAPAGVTSCGDSSCNSSAGETCTTCNNDCDNCTAPTSNLPPWPSPLPEMLVMPGTSAQRAQTIGTGLDSLLPADSPYPRTGLVGYVPREGVLYGPPLSRLFASTSKAGGTSSSVVGAQGQGLRFGNDTTPTYGMQRLQFHDRLPTKPGAISTNPGGMTVAMWIRVPKTAPDTINGLATLRLMDNGAVFSQTAQCMAGRPGDPNLEVKCPVEYPNLKPTINSVYAWYGVPGASLVPGNNACEALVGAKPGACQDSGIQALAEVACIGKSECVVTAPAAPACATGQAVAPQLYVRATCSYGNEQFANTLTIAPTSGGNRLRFGRGEEASVQSKESLKDGQWHHIALTFRPFGASGATGLTTLFVDGLAQESSTRPVIGAVQELVLGGARMFGVTASTMSGEWVPAVADVDDVFVYNRPLGDTEVRQLKNKRDFSVLRQWPILSAQEVVATGAGLTAGATASTDLVQAERVNTAGSYTGNGVGTPLTATWEALSPTTGKYAPSVADEDIANLTTWTVAGWVRPKNATPGAELFRLSKGTYTDLTVKRTTACNGTGIAVTFLNGTVMQPTNCEHGIATGKWSFVAVVQKSTSWWVYVDGTRIGLIGGGTKTPALLAVPGAVTFEAGPDCSLGWVALWGRDLSQDELEVARNPGPVVWLDKGRYQSGGSTQVRDYANYFNRTSESVEDRPIFRNKQGLPVPSAAPQTSALLTLSSYSNNEVFEVLMPARGRLAGLNDELVRPFGFVARVRVPAGKDSWDLIGHVKADWQNTDKWDGRVASKLNCDFTQFANTLACNVEVRVRQNDYFTYKYVSETRKVKATWYPTEVDVAITWDGTTVRVAMGSPDVDFSSGLVASTGTTAETPKSSLLSLTRTGPVGIIGSFSAPNRPAGSFFRLTPGQYEFGKTEYRYVKLYGRGLTNTELLQLVEGNCDTLSCSDTNRSCISGGDNGGTAVCGECKSGSFEAGGTAGTMCFVRRGWGEQCRSDAECASNQCGGSGTCTSNDVNTECSAACRQSGKSCIRVGSGTWAYTQCDSDCLPFFSPTNGYNGTDGCTWTPTEEPGAVCSADDQCKSGGCSGVQDFVYNISVDRNPACKSDGTCPGWYNTSDGNKPFKCNKKYGMQPGDADVCMWNPTGNTGIKSVKRCDSTSTQSCGEIRRTPTVTQKKGPLGDTLYKCGECEAGSFKGSDNVTRPLWVKRWRFLSPEACATMHANLVRAWVGGRYSDVPNFLYETPTAANLGQFILEKPRGSVLTPAEFASMITKGVGPELVEYVLDQDVADRYNAAYSYITLADCATGLGDSKKSPFTDPNNNYMICAPNQFPDGTQCPPPGIDAALADSFCQSGFCARDTGVCEEGYGRFEETDSASRRDDKESDDGGLGGMDFVQKNNTTLEFKKIINPAKAKNDPQARSYSLAVSTANTLKFFGATLDVMSIKNTMSGVLDGSKEAAFSANVVLFGISQPQSGGPPLKCPGMSWENGKLQKPGNSGNCELPTPGNHGVSLPTLKLCTPAPGGCEDDDSNSPFNTVQKASGPLCVKRFMFCGPVPVQIEAGVVIEACLGYGAGVDPETYEGSFEIRPEIGVSLEVSGGVGFDVGIVEVFAGIKAAITIVNIAFPIKWVLSVAQLSNDANQVVANMWQLEYARVVTAELNVLKLALSIVVEAGVAIFKAEWEYVVFEYEGLTFSWELANDSLFSKKVDLQHKTANQ